MTTDQLHRANQLNQKVESTKALLQKLEGGRIKTVTVHVFDEEQALYEVLDLTDIPRNQIKIVLLEKAKKDYENAKEKFANLGTLEKQNLNNGTQPALQETDIFPISKVVFFDLKNGKYVAQNGVELTTDLLVKNRHKIFQDEGYVIIEKEPDRYRN